MDHDARLLVGFGFGSGSTTGAAASSFSLQNYADLMRVAAVQLEVVLGDVLANIEACEAMARSAARDGAELIVLPEFFTAGVGFLPELAHTAVAPEGVATTMLCSIAKEAGVMIGGSFLCRDADGEVRNAFVLADRNGVVGRHDKDLPTAWENAFYIGGTDDGVIDVDDLSVGVAMCWEFIRSQTARRLRVASTWSSEAPTG